MNNRWKPYAGFRAEIQVQDALTLMIMADQRVARDVYGKVYSGDWAEFAAKADAWHGRKRRQRAGA